MSEITMAHQMGTRASEPREPVVFILKKREVLLHRGDGSRDLPKEAWVASSGNELRPAADPVTALNRFVSVPVAERMLQAWSAFQDVPTSGSEISQIEVE